MCEAMLVCMTTAALGTWQLGVTGSCQMLNLGAMNKTQALCKNCMSS